MQTQLIKKSVEINASKDKVWDVLINDKFIRTWYAEFHQGAYAETDWQVGSKVLFLDDKRNGLLGKVVKNKTNEILSVEYQGMVNEGVEDLDSSEAKSVKGGHETYILSDKNGKTHLAIELDMSSDCFDSMSSSWEKALKKIKELSEKN